MAHPPELPRPGEHRALRPSPECEGTGLSCEIRSPQVIDPGCKAMEFGRCAPAPIPPPRVTPGRQVARRGMGLPPPQQKGCGGWGPA